MRWPWSKKPSSDGQDGIGIAVGNGSIAVGGKGGNGRSGRGGNGGSAFASGRGSVAIGGRGGDGK